MGDPGTQPIKTAEIRRKDVLHTAVYDRGRITAYDAEHRHHIAADFRMRPELDVAQDGNRVAVDLAVDGGITEDGDRSVQGGAGDLRIAENGYHRHGFAGAGGRSEDRDDRFGVLPGRQSRIMSDAHQVAVLMVIPIRVLSPLRTGTPIESMAGSARITCADIVRRVISRPGHAGRCLMRGV